MLKKNAAICFLGLLVSAGMAVEANAQSSGLLLGIRYTKLQGRGLYVQNTLEGYSADGQLRRGDTLLRIANEAREIFSINSGRQLEETKARIGRNTPADVEILRRYQDGTSEKLYFRVVFQPVGGLPAGQRPRGVTGGGSVATFSASDGSFFEPRRQSGGASGSFFRSGR